MAFVLSLLYFLTAYLSPETLWGQLAAFHIGIILAALIFFVSLPSFLGAFVWKTPQSVALVGLAFAVLLSVLFTGWAGGAVKAFQDFIPNAFAYFLICLHCTTKKRLQLVVLTIMFVCGFVIANGYHDLGEQASIPARAVTDEGLDQPYLMAQTTDSGEAIYRIRGQGFINDPNDLAQLIVCLIPLVFIFWKPKSLLRNIAFVIVPVCGLLYGAFLTHSRGAVVALLAMAIVAGRRWIGTIASVLLAVGGFAAATALNFTGGRNISVESGTDRLDLWGDGLQILKSHPLFGVGFNGMGDYTGGHTAHNSLVVCAAELGMFGLYFWSMFLYPMMRDVLVISSAETVNAAEPVLPQQMRLPGPIREVAAIDPQEIIRLGRLMLLSLTGFLVAGWFLSRAFVMTFFLLGGMVEVIFEMALKRGMVSPRLSLVTVGRKAGFLAVGMLLFMYLMLRVTNLTH